MDYFEVTIKREDGEEITLAIDDDFESNFEDFVGDQDYEAITLYAPGCEENILEYEDFNDYEVDEYIAMAEQIQELGDSYELLTDLYKETGNLTDMLELADKFDMADSTGMDIIHYAIDNFYDNSYESIINIVYDKNYSTYDSYEDYGYAVGSELYEIPDNLSNYIDYARLGEDIAQDQAGVWELDDGTIVEMYDYN